MRNLTIAILSILILGGASYGAYSLITKKKKGRPKPPKVVKTVFIDTVENRTVPIVIPANGNLTALRRVELYAEVQGVLKGGNKLFKPGQKYVKGESLLRLDASEYYATVQSQKSNLYNLVTSIMPDLRLDYPEAYPKWQTYLSNFDINKSVPPLPQMNSEQEKFFVTGRNIVSTYYNVKNLEERLSKYSIRAPFSGILTEALVTEGTLVRNGQKLGEFIDPSIYELEVAINKSFSDLLKVGEEVKLNNLENTKSWTGRVSRINGRIDQATQTISAFIEVKGEDLKEGIYLEAHLNARNEENAISISRKLLVDESQVFVVKDSILDLIPVTPVYFSDKEVVVKGLPNGTRILSRTVPGAYAGMLVKVYSEKKTETAKAEQ
ncbi:HlyD family efflux transporter periplasmic adaptor subunit [Leptobacterium flavescens]|uniref:HlyD family efflux transporter periplasmic adaptor subunit n=1 Tax=Leptobacterium flavescens TaxID=472055 RepID=A0A6P0UNU2_9FLAO|nr:HlyD family efflux transporter periplasmic adaptor subunit [Leptobacterium flavescens]NER14835.1 HlyD family efflux transporter periplasmic adaptor subunit [Leptobacterium flavescens]